MPGYIPLAPEDQSISQYHIPLLGNVVVITAPLSEASETLVLPSENVPLLVPTCVNGLKVG